MLWLDGNSWCYLCGNLLEMDGLTGKGQLSLWVPRAGT